LSRAPQTKTPDLKIRGIFNEREKELLLEIVSSVQEAKYDCKNREANNLFHKGSFITFHK
jgi:hypothetical protein